MGLTPKFRAIIKPRDCHYEIYEQDEEKYSLYMDGFEEGTHVFVTVEKITKKKERSLEQNSYYWGVVIKILEDDGPGYSKDEWHEALKAKFLTYENVPGIPTQLSTTQLSTIEFEIYLEKIRRWAASFLGINIPEPNQVKFN